MRRYLGGRSSSGGAFDYWQITTGPDDEPGINGAITPRMTREQGTTDTIAVESLDESIEKIVAAGGTITQPKRAIPGIGYIAYCADTEGNRFGVIKPDMSAK
jgi:predicted enzyme related to lactoylglutathione lyase